MKKIRSAVVLGDPAEKIIQFAREIGIDMIVIASREPIEGPKMV